MLELNKIYNMDCLQGMQLIQDNKIDCILTDIPYNEVNRESGGIRNYNFGIADDAIFDLAKTLNEMWRICNGSFYIFCGIGQISDIFNFFKSKKVNGRLIIYEKTNPVPTNGEFTWLSGIESCVFAKKSGATFNGHCKNTVLRYPIAQRTGHPTPKPIELFGELITTSTNEGDTILDPFMGGGYNGSSSTSTWS